MDWIEITFKSGLVKKFTEKGRAGGSWTISIKYDNGMVIVTDEYGATEAFPQQDILNVRTASTARGW